MSYVMPALILLLLGYARCKRVNVYDAFTRGAQEALPLLVQVLPFMAAMLIAMNLFRSSGALSVLISGLSRFSTALAFPQNSFRFWCSGRFPAVRRLRFCRMCLTIMALTVFLALLQA